MTKQIILVSTLALSLFGAGCVGTGPNTQQGAVTGGVLGAAAGAIIGHNSRGGDALGGAILGGTVGAIAGGTIGNSVDQKNGTIYPGTQPERRVYRERAYAPPPPPAQPPVVDVVTPSPAPNALWVPGYWSYDGRAYSWIVGHWEMPPPNVHAYVVAHWERQPQGYAFIPSYWR
jgi:outer membrane protein with glycine zipper/YXWGXW repeat-containing protein